MSESRHNSSREVVRKDALDPWQWDDQRIKAARLIAQGQTLPDVARHVQVGRNTLTRWLRRSPFRRKVDRLIAEMELQAERYAIARKERRIAAINDRWDRLRGVIRDREETYRDDKEPGARHGVMVKRVKITGGGETGRAIEVWDVDRALLAELRELEDAAAREMGHRRQVGEESSGPRTIVQVQIKTVVRGTDGTPIPAEEGYRLGICTLDGRPLASAPALSQPSRSDDAMPSAEDACPAEDEPHCNLLPTP